MEARGNLTFSNSTYVSGSGGGSRNFASMTAAQRQQYLSDQIIKARDELQSGSGSFNANANSALAIASASLYQINSILANVWAELQNKGATTTTTANNTRQHAVINRNINQQSTANNNNNASPSHQNGNSNVGEGTPSTSNPNSMGGGFSFQNNAAVAAAAGCLGPAFVVQRLRLALFVAEAHGRLKNHGKAYDVAKDVIKNGSGRHSAQAHFIAAREAYLLNLIEESVALFSTAEALLTSGLPEVEEVNTVAQSWAAVGVDPSIAPSDMRPSEVQGFAETNFSNNGGDFAKKVYKDDHGVLIPGSKSLSSSITSLGPGGLSAAGQGEHSSRYHSAVYEWAGELPAYRAFKQQAETLFQLTVSRTIPNSVQSSNAVTRFVRRHMAATGNTSNGLQHAGTITSTNNNNGSNLRSSQHHHTTGGLAVLIKNYTDLPLSFSFGFLDEGSEWDSMLRPPRLIPSNSLGACVVRAATPGGSASAGKTPVGATLGFKFDETSQIMLQLKAPSGVEKISQVAGVGNTPQTTASHPSLSSPSTALCGVHVAPLSMTLTDNGIKSLLTQAVIDSSTTVQTTPTIPPYWWEKPSYSTPGPRNPPPIEKRPSSSAPIIRTSGGGGDLARDFHHNHIPSTVVLSDDQSESGDSICEAMDAIIDPAVAEALERQKGLSAAGGTKSSPAKHQNNHSHDRAHHHASSITSSVNCSSTKSKVVFGHVSYVRSTAPVVCRGAPQATVVHGSTAGHDHELIAHSSNDKLKNDNHHQKSNGAPATQNNNNTNSRIYCTSSRVYQIAAQRPHVSAPNVLVFSIHEYRCPTGRLSELDLTSIFEFLHPDHRYKAALINRPCRALMNALPPNNSYYEPRFVNEGVMIDTNLAPSDTVGPIHRAQYPTYAIHRDFFDSPFTVRDKGSVSFDFGLEKSSLDTSLQHVLAFDPSSDTLLFHYLASSGTVTTERYLFYGPRRRMLLLQISENNLMGFITKKSATVYVAGGSYASPTGSSRMAIGKIEHAADNTLNFIATFENTELACDPVLASSERNLIAGGGVSGNGSAKPGGLASSLFGIGGAASTTSSSSTSSTSKCLYRVQRRYVPGTKTIEQILVTRGPDYPHDVLPAHLQQQFRVAAGSEKSSKGVVLCSPSSAVSSPAFSVGTPATGRYAAQGRRQHHNSSPPLGRPTPNALFAGAHSMLHTANTISYEFVQRPPKAALTHHKRQQQISPPRGLVVVTDSKVYNASNNSNSNGSGGGSGSKGVVLRGPIEHGVVAEDHKHTQKNNTAPPLAQGVVLVQGDTSGSVSGFSPSNNSTVTPNNKYLDPVSKGVGGGNRTTRAAVASPTVELRNFVAKYTRPSSSTLYSSQTHANSANTTRLGDLTISEGSDAALAFLLVAYAFEQWSQS